MTVCVTVREVEASTVDEFMGGSNDDDSAETS